MKKILHAIVLVIFSNLLMAQSPFFQSTNYVGAFAPAPTARWTDGWCNFDPQNTNYPTATVQVVSNILTNTTWTANNVYWINDAIIYVKPGATLTIEPGTIIRGSGKGTICVERGAKINAQGTITQPIIFTSNSAAGSRNYGNWGGIVICGAARHNLIAGPNATVEGGIGDAASQTGVHGGNNDDDSSGVFSYCRIEFSGISLTAQANSEINGLSMYSVGKKTKIDHIQVSYCGDDSFEWFGGAVDCRYLVAFRGWDDEFDTDNGFRGRIQFALSVRDPQVGDQSGSNGFESDNDASGSSRWPKTKAVFSNVTLVGPINSSNPGSINANYRRAAHIRRNSGINIFNSVFMGYPTGMLMDARRTVTNFCQDTSFFRHNVFSGMNTDWTLASSPVSDTLCMTNTAGVGAFFLNVNNDNDTLNSTAQVNLVDPYNLLNPDARPSGAPLSSGAVFTNLFLLPLVAPPVATFNSSTDTICEGSSISFTSSQPSQPFSTYSWSITGGAPSSSTNASPNATFNLPGTYSVTLTVSNTLGTSSSTQTIVVLSNPSTPSISQAGSVLSINNTYNTYQWYLNGNPINNANTQTFNADTTAGNYSVQVSNAFGCTSTSSTYSYTTGLAAYTSSNNAICEGSSITYTATTSGATSYNWVFAGGNPSSSNLQTVTVTYNNSGTFATILSVSQGSNNASSNGIVTVYDLPVPNIILNGNDLSSSQSYASYQWLLNGTPISGATSSTYNVTVDGAYTLEVIDDNGCSGQSTVYNFYASLEQNNLSGELSLYPNPASDIVNVTLSNGELINDIVIIDLSGKVVFSQSNINLSFSVINIDQFNAGVYILSVNGKNTKSTKKLIVQ